MNWMDIELVRLAAGVVRDAQDAKPGADLGRAVLQPGESRAIVSPMESSARIRRPA